MVSLRRSSLTSVSKGIYTQRRLTLFSLGGLASIGLIQIDATSRFVLQKRPKIVTASYHGRSVQLTLPKDTGNSLVLGHVIMTPSGEQLSRIIKRVPIDGFFEFAYDSWAGQSLVPPRMDPAK